MYTSETFMHASWSVLCWIHLSFENVPVSSRPVCLSTSICSKTCVYTPIPLVSWYVPEGYVLWWIHHWFENVSVSSSPAWLSTSICMYTSETFISLLVCALMDSYIIWESAYDLHVFSLLVSVDCSRPVCIPSRPLCLLVCALLDSSIIWERACEF